MPSVWSAIAIAGLALKGTAQDAKAASYLSAADTQYEGVILPAFAYVGDYWHEGFTYVQPAKFTIRVWPQPSAIAAPAARRAVVPGARAESARAAAICRSGPF